MQRLHPSIGSDANLMEAAKVVALSRSDALVVDRGKAVGVVGGVDILEAVAEGRRLDRLKVSDVMKPILAVRVGASMNELLDVARRSGGRTIFFGDSRNPVGRMEVREVLELVTRSWNDVEVHRALSTLVRHRMAELLSVRPMSVEQIAKEVGVKPITARHHLDVMRRSGIVGTEEIHGSVGRPLTLFRLTSFSPKRP